MFEATEEGVGNSNFLNSTNKHVTTKDFVLHHEQDNTMWNGSVELAFCLFKSSYTLCDFCSHHMAIGDVAMRLFLVELIESNPAKCCMTMCPSCQIRENEFSSLFYTIESSQTYSNSFSNPGPSCMTNERCRQILECINIPHSHSLSDPINQQIKSHVKKMLEKAYVAKELNYSLFSSLVDRCSNEELDLLFEKDVDGKEEMEDVSNERIDEFVVNSPSTSNKRGVGDMELASAFGSPAITQQIKSSLLGSSAKKKGNAVDKAYY